jgi:hypothetical protein
MLLPMKFNISNACSATLGLSITIKKCELISSSVVAPSFELLKSLILVLPADAPLLDASCIAGRKHDIALDACCSDLYRWLLKDFLCWNLMIL